MIGKTLGHNRIIEKIGEGGMGVVYRARDEHLNRDVAVKVLPQGRLPDESARKRFRREALLLSRLNHPNIEIIFDFDTQDQTDFLVMEYIPGQTLRKQLARGPLTEREISRLGAQLAEGLASAHQQGIVHRDLKPANIMITPDGLLKILDYGLAKLLPSDRHNTPATDLTTRNAAVPEPPVEEPETRSDAIPGTFPYMAPEQVGGEPVDARADIYAAGNVLYEMAVGRRPFENPSARDILVEPPTPPSRFRRGISSRLEEIILRCLEKDPEDRYYSARDLAIDLRRLGSAAPPSPGPIVQWRRWGIAALCAVVVVLAIILWPRPQPIPEYSPIHLTAGKSWEGQPVLSPDGSRIAFTSVESGNHDLYIVNAQGGTPLQITQDPATDRDPAWFPDGSRLAFASDRNGRMGIWKTGQFGGGATLLLDNAEEPAISPDRQQIAFSRTVGQGYKRIGVASLADTSKATMLTTDADGLWDHEHPAWSPDGSSVCYSSRHDLWKVSASGGPARRLTVDGERDMEPVWSPGGDYIYFSSYRGQSRAIWRVGSEGGSPERITSGTGPESHPDISRNGARLTYATSDQQLRLVMVNRASGEEIPVSGQAWMAAMAPDESRMVFVNDIPGRESTLLVQELKNGVPEGKPFQLTDETGNASHPAFSPDSRWIAYYRIIGRERDIWLIPAAGGRPSRVTDHPAVDTHPAWSPDGAKIVFASQREDDSQIYAIPVLDGKATEPAARLTHFEGAAQAPTWSPDGKWIAFLGVRDDQREVYVITSGGGPASQVTREARASRMRWDEETGDLLVSGYWGRNCMSLRRVPVRGGVPMPAFPGVQFGPFSEYGLFDISRNLLVYTQESMSGDIWLLNATGGLF